MDNSITPLSEIGLFGLIERYTKIFHKRHETTLKSIENDAAVIKIRDGNLVTAQTMMLEGIHFDLTYFPLKHLGYKAVVSGISDIIASGTKPTHINIALGISGKMSLEATDQLMDGVILACEKYELDLTGFRPSSSLTGLSIAVSSFGFTENTPVSRFGARENDLICVTGDLGAAFMGLQLLEREKKVMKASGETNPDFGGYDYLLERQLKPEARIGLLSMLKDAGIRPTSMILIREGLAASLLRLCKASDTGCHIYENKIPIDHTTTALGDEMEINPVVAALNGGEDFEILFTITLNDYQKIEKEGKKLDNVFLIGHITNKTKGYILETNAGDEVPLKARGWGKEQDE